MEPLQFNLGIILAERIVMRNLFSIIGPYVKDRLKMSRETHGDAKVRQAMTVAEREYVLLDIDPLQNSIQNYASIAIVYGFMAMFVTALPIAPFFTMINNYVKVKVETIQMFNLFQRTVPVCEEDIGVWDTIFMILTVVAVVTNAGLICFTMSVLADANVNITSAGQLW